MTDFLRLTGQSCCAAIGVSLLLAATARAELESVPFVSVDFQHNSNIFAVSAADPILITQGDTTRADSIVTYLAGVDMNGAWGLQKLTAHLEDRQVDYSHYGRLDHNEYRVDVDFHWALGSRFDGNLDVRRDHTMALFKDRESTQLEVDTIQDETANVGFKITNNFRLEAGALNHEAQTPLEGYSDARIIEDTEYVALRYTGVSNLSYGLQYSYLNGEFKDSTNPSKYNQSSEDFVFTYGVAAVAKLDATIGYTKRSYEGINDTTGGITGLIDLSRQLTAKTSITAEVRRAINVYVVGGGSEIDTSESLVAKWLATGRLAVLANVAHTHAVYGQQSTLDSFDSGRSDQYNSVTMSVIYQIKRWLTVRPYGEYETRRSNETLFSYNGTIVGIELRGQFQ